MVDTDIQALKYPLSEMLLTILGQYQEMTAFVQGWGGLLDDISWWKGFKVSNILIMILNFVEIFNCAMKKKLIEVEVETVQWSK